MSTTPVANLPPVSTTPGTNCHRYQRHREQICHRCHWHRWQIMWAISGCRHLTCVTVEVSSLCTWESNSVSTHKPRHPLYWKVQGRPILYYSQFIFVYTPLCLAKFYLGIYYFRRYILSLTFLPHLLISFIPFPLCRHRILLSSFHQYFVWQCFCVPVFKIAWGSSPEFRKYVF